VKLLQQIVPALAGVIRPKFVTQVKRCALVHMD
jgi:hypothetical protein